MSEIRLHVDLAYPPERVWQAITDRRELSDWLLPTEVDPSNPSRFRMHPPRSYGFAAPLFGHVIEAVRPTRLVMRWQGEELYVRVTMRIERTADGCRLTFVQRGFFGTAGTMRRRMLHTMYRRSLTERLPAALDGPAAIGEPSRDTAPAVARSSRSAGSSDDSGVPGFALTRRGPVGVWTRRVRGPASRRAARGWVYGNPPGPEASQLTAGDPPPPHWVGPTQPSLNPTWPQVGPARPAAGVAPVLVRGKAPVPKPRIAESAGRPASTRSVTHRHAVVNPPRGAGRSRHSRQVVVRRLDRRPAGPAPAVPARSLRELFAAGPDSMALYGGLLVLVITLVLMLK